jgi:pimeloyl-ACP methyl ester carboxylesterase
MTQLVQIQASGFTFQCRIAGEVGGDPVILLHGCPETSAMWEGLLPQLAAAGYNCLAPDQRGYSPGARPGDVSAYDHRALAGDVFALADAAGFERFHIVAHDWGAAVGWCALACDDQRRIASFASLSIPHYRAFAEAVRDDPEEDYYRQFLAAVIAERGAVETAWAADDFAQLRAIYGSFQPELVGKYYDVLSQPGALTAILDWYRATDGHMKVLDGSSLSFGPVDVPTLLIWGNVDPFVRRMAVDLAPPYMTGSYEVVELAAGHWLVQEEPEIVAAHILRHLKDHSPC